MRISPEVKQASVLFLQCFLIIRWMCIFTLQGRIDRYLTRWKESMNVFHNV